MDYLLKKNNLHTIIIIFINSSIAINKFIKATIKVILSVFSLWLLFCFCFFLLCFFILHRLSFLILNYNLFFLFCQAFLKGPFFIIRASIYLHSLTKKNKINCLQAPTFTLVIIFHIKKSYKLNYFNC